MANVLGELFSDIAQSIRSGLGGYNGTMKPVEFAGKIDEIVAMLEEEVVSRPSMDGMASTSNLKIVRGNFRPEADRTRITIAHGLGVMPDIIMVYQSGPPRGYDTVAEFVGAYPILSAWGVKSSVNVTTRSGMNLPGYGFATAYGIDDMPEEERPGGYIYCPDEDTFQVGRQAADGAVGLAANLDYYWIAISGIGSGAAEPVVQALTVTENGTYAPPEGVDGYSSVVVNVDPTKLTILREQKLDGFAPDDNLGYILIDPAEPFTLTEGEEYSVSWDGTTYTSTAQKADTYLGTIVYIGNGTLLDLPGNNEPFAIGCANGMVMYLAFTDPAASHTVGIWKEVKQQGGGGSLPAGAYWEVDEAGLPNAYPQRLFMYNGVLYCQTTSYYTGAAVNGYLYKLENGAWVKVSDQTNVHNPMLCRDSIEYNGKVHFLGFYQSHWVYDGQGDMQKLNDIPGSVNTYYFRSFVQDGKLKFLDYDTSDVLVWDEASDTWSVEATKVTGTTKDVYLCVFNGNGKVYVYHEQSAKGMISIYENGVLTKQCDTTARFNNVKNNDVVGGKYVYNAATHPDKKYKAIAKMNLETGEVAFLGRVPEYYADSDLRLYAPDRVRIYGISHYNGSSINKYNLILHEVTE